MSLEYIKIDMTRVGLGSGVALILALDIEVN